jgi:hypothetical protein
VAVPPKVRESGDLLSSAAFRGLGESILAAMKDTMKRVGLLQLSRTVQITKDCSIEVSSRFGLDTVSVVYNPALIPVLKREIPEILSSSIYCLMVNLDLSAWFESPGPITADEVFQRYYCRIKSDRTITLITEVEAEEECYLTDPWYVTMYRTWASAGDVNPWPECNYSQYVARYRSDMAPNDSVSITLPEFNICLCIGMNSICAWTPSSSKWIYCVVPTFYTLDWTAGTDGYFYTLLFGWAIYADQEYWVGYGTPEAHTEIRYNVCIHLAGSYTTSSTPILDPDISAEAAEIIGGMGSGWSNFRTVVEQNERTATYLSGSCYSVLIPAYPSGVSTVYNDSDVYRDYSDRPINPAILTTYSRFGILDSTIFNAILPPGLEQELVVPLKIRVEKTETYYTVYQEVYDFSVDSEMLQISIISISTVKLVIDVSGNIVSLDCGAIPFPSTNDESVIYDTLLGISLCEVSSTANWSTIFSYLYTMNEGTVLPSEFLQDILTPLYGDPFSEDAQFALQGICRLLPRIQQEI